MTAVAAPYLVACRFLPGTLSDLEYNSADSDACHTGAAADHLVRCLSHRAVLLGGSGADSLLPCVHLSE